MQLIFRRTYATGRTKLPAARMCQKASGLARCLMVLPVNKYQILVL
jgi:hypothetical protein